MKFIMYLFLLFALLLSCNNEKKYSEKEKNQKIVYNVLLDENGGDYEVFSMNLDGSDKTNLSTSPSVDWAYYTSGNKIYFISDRDTCASCFYLYKMNSDGTSKKRITDFKLSDSWLSSCKDGDELIVKPHASVDSVFYIISNDGDFISKLDVGMAYSSDPLYIDDGNKVVFRGSEHYSKQEEGYIDELYMVNRDGSNLRQLTHYPANDTTAKWYNYHAGPPQWFSGWNVISYISFQKGSYSIFTIDTLGQENEQISRDGYNQGWHSWSADGMLVFDGSDTSYNANYDIYLLMQDSIQPIRLTFDSLYEQAPMFVEK